MVAEQIGELLVVVGLALDRLGEDRRVRGDAPDPFVEQASRGCRRSGSRVSGCRAKGSVPVARRGRGVSSSGVSSVSYRDAAMPIRAVARSTSASAVIPNFSSTTEPAADAPKWSIPITSSTYRSQPNGLAASIAIAGTPDGSTDLAVGVVLGLEQVPGRERDHPGRDTLPASRCAAASTQS